MRRWKRHIADAKKDKPWAIQRAIRKYGDNSFTVQEISVVNTKEESNNLERLFVILFKSHNPEFGYNLTIGGAGIEGYKLTEEQRKRKSESSKGRIGYWLGKTHSEEHKKKVSLSLIGNTRAKGSKHPGRKRPDLAEMNRRRGKNYVKPI